jgi:2-haloacid dehalogenase
VAWVFDAYGTLWDVGCIEAAVAQARVPDSNRFLSLWRQKQLEYAFLRTLTGHYAPFSLVTRDALQYTLETVGVTLTANQEAALLDAWFHPQAFGDAKELLASLKGEGRWILSNGDPAMLDAGVDATGLRGCLEGYVSVDQVQRYKPHPETYRLAVAVAQASPEEVVFVSSNAWDVAGAARFGFRTVWVNRTGAALDRLGVEPWRVVPSLAAVKDRGCR